MNINKKYVIAGVCVLLLSCGGLYYFNNSKADKLPEKMKSVSMENDELVRDKKTYDKMIKENIKLSKGEFKEGDLKKNSSSNSTVSSFVKDGKIDLPSANIMKNGKKVKDVKYSDLYNVKSSDDNIDLKKFKKVKDINTLFSNNIDANVNPSKYKDYVNTVKVAEAMEKDPQSQLIKLYYNYGNNDLKAVTVFANIDTKYKKPGISVSSSNPYELKQNKDVNDYDRMVNSLHSDYDSAIDSAISSVAGKNYDKFSTDIDNEYLKLYPNFLRPITVSGPLSKPIKIYDRLLDINVEGIGISGNRLNVVINVKNNKADRVKLTYPLNVSTMLPSAAVGADYLRVSMIPDVAQPEYLGPGEEYTVTYSTSLSPFDVRRSSEIYIDIVNISDLFYAKNIAWKQ